jgi:hypothetical protein
MEEALKRDFDWNAIGRSIESLEKIETIIDEDIVVPCRRTSATDRRCPAWLSEQ